MGLAHSPKITTDGLVFAYDMGNIQKSWLGSPATNLFTETNLSNWSKSAIVAQTSFNTPFGSPSFIITDGNASNYQLIGRNTTVPNDTSTYTVSLLVRKTSGGTSSRLGFNIGFNTGGTVVAYNLRFNSDTGVSAGGVGSGVVDYGNWWYWYFNLVNNGTGNTNIYCDFYPATGFYNGSDNSAATGSAIVGAFMLVSGSTAVRFVNGTRSNTQAILDLTGQTTITASSLTYSNDGTFNFNGSTNRIYQTTIPSTYSSVSNSLSRSWEVIVRPSASLTTSAIFGHKVRAVCSYFCNGGIYIWNGKWAFNWYDNANYQFLDSGITASANQYFHIIGTYDAADQKTRIYVNGSLYATSSATNMNYLGSIAEYAIGFNSKNEFGGGGNYTDYFQGLIPIARYYSGKAVSVTEVRQNFNAQRGRYGI